MKNLLAVGFGGMAGSLVRAIIYEGVGSFAGLWTVNLLGSLLIGFVAGRFREKSAPFRLFVSTGFLGSFTTFSAFSAEWFRLLDRTFTSGLLLALVMTVFSVIAAATGLKIGRQGAGT